MAQDVQTWRPPSTTLSIAQMGAKAELALRSSTSPQDALRNAKKLVAAWPYLNAQDPAGYAASLGAVLADYPLGVVEECCDPRSGLARTREFPPTVQSVIEWCDKRVKQHQGAIIWARKEAGKQAESDRFTPEYRQSMLQRLKALMHGLFDKQPQAEAAE